MKPKLRMLPWIMLAATSIVQASNHAPPKVQKDESVPVVRDIEADVRERRCDTDMDINLVIYVGEEALSDSICPLSPS